MQHDYRAKGHHCRQSTDLVCCHGAVVDVSPRASHMSHIFTEQAHSSNVTPLAVAREAIADPEEAVVATVLAAVAPVGAQGTQDAALLPAEPGAAAASA